ncbi:hypothetical protein LX36DRAFT_276038 [Colletotrichum falcatum]|nr:hypothetical protein LX36DRAFT_276038 [Colletotrichum falcatum]
MSGERPVPAPWTAGRLPKGRRREEQASSLRFASSFPGGPSHSPPPPFSSMEGPKEGRESESKSEGHLCPPGPGSLRLVLPAKVDLDQVLNPNLRLHLVFFSFLFFFPAVFSSVFLSSGSQLPSVACLVLSPSGEHAGSPLLHQCGGEPLVGWSVRILSAQYFCQSINRNAVARTLLHLAQNFLSAALMPHFGSARYPYTTAAIPSAQLGQVCTTAETWDDVGLTAKQLQRDNRWQPQS